LSPRYWAIHLLALVLLAAAVMLGVWQLDAWKSKREASARDLTTVAAIPLAKAIGPDDPFPAKYVGQPVSVQGTWLPESTFVVSGRERGDVEGYWVVTPVAVAGTESAIPVVRGWTPSAEKRPAAPSGPVTLKGWLQPAEGTGEVDENPSDDVLPQLRIADALHFVDQDLYGGYVIAAATDAGLQKAELDQLPPAPRFSAIRNLFYAVEWWFFGGFVVFMWWRWLVDDVLRRDEDDVEA
jgi:cytochrome oxidase assembly protein ShyY1